MFRSGERSGFGLRGLFEAFLEPDLSKEMFGGEKPLEGRSERKRPGWESYFLQIARLASTRSTCLRRQVGAVLVREKKILATGYNGAPSGTAHCLDIGCLREKEGIPSGERHELCRGLHAEQNAIIQAAYHGVSIRGSTLFCTNFPCVICSKMLINAGIQGIYYIEGYPDSLSERMLEEAGLEVHRVRPEEEQAR